MVDINNMRKFLCMFAVVMIASSCNIDDVITTTIEDDNYRPRTEASSAKWTKVFEFTPAPGQFVGEVKADDYTGEEKTAEDAVKYAERRLTKELYVSLGGFGGYIVVGFDHSIDNNHGYDIAIKGNSFGGSSEPGIVWVMQDENGDGKPNDTWYELVGSESGKAETKQNYSVTYFRPEAEGQPVKWRDSEGQEGEIDYLKTYHKQPYYYPTWIKEDSYTLSGTCLQARNYDASGKGSYWVLPEYDWGYVDNFSPTDRLTSEDNANAAANANHFDISNAIDANGQPMDLKYIDFVKVQTGVNSKSGWLGEVSTEVFGFYDYQMMIE